MSSFNILNEGAGSSGYDRFDIKHALETAASSSPSPIKSLSALNASPLHETS